MLYVLDNRLNLKTVEASVTMKNFCREMKAAGRLPDLFSERELAQLRQGFQLLRR
jgi:hypothetical protein